MVLNGNHGEPGRTDPCPCGSGKKYSKCCLAQKDAAVAADLGWERLRRTEGEVVEALLKYVSHRYDNDALGEAWIDFTLLEDLPLDAETTPEVEAFFLPWFLFNRNPDPMVTNRAKELPEIPAALRFLAEKGAMLDSYQRRFITEACDQPYSFFQVTNTIPGRKLMLRDIMLQREITVHERQASSTLSKGRILFTRVVTIDGDSIMLGGAPVAAPGSYFPEVVELRRELAPVGLLTRDDLHEYDIELRGLYFEFRERSLNPAPLQIQNTDGDPLQLTCIH